MSSTVKKIVGLVEKYGSAYTQLMLFGELVLGIIIIQLIPYTEIDWIAYMQEVRGFLSGEMDYTKLRGDTGPLVYPAGFVYLFSFLNKITDDGNDVRLAQYIWLFFYLASQTVTFVLYRKFTKMPTILLTILCLSHRIHSIFMLRCFNDVISNLLLLMACYFFGQQKWGRGSVFFSLAVSVKMNILLFAPGLTLVFLEAGGLVHAVVHIGYCAIVQLVLGFPFLVTYPIQYISKAFEFSRVFTYKWTVNLKFLDEETFTSKPVARLLLLGHVGSLLLFYFLVFKPSSPVTTESNPSKGKVSLWSKPVLGLFSTAVAKVNSDRMLTLLFVSNFCGIVCSRTLHYQFYSWYFHTLPLIVWKADALPIAVRAICLIGIEYAFNIFPATPLSSAVLQVSHWLLLIGLFISLPKQLSNKQKEN